ncbi:MAG: hypothetical protein IJE89_03455 [Bacilli bacterium]|nr:hypothetical protein [Bacilli bacterium]
MKKIIEFCKEKYKILIPFMVGIVLLVTLVFLYKEYRYENTKNKKEISVYQYFGGIRTEYTAIVTYNLKDILVGIEAKDKKIEYDSKPVYYKDEDKVIFPNEMTAIFPLNNGLQYKIYKYATYYKENDLHYIKNSSDIGNYSYFFLYDGKDVFFFPDEVTLNINNKKYKDLGAMSYVTLVGGTTLIYYDTSTDTSEVIETDNDIVTVTSNNVNVNISERYFLSFGKNVLLFSPNNLNPLSKMIDK